MSAFLERVQAALAADYVVERELASGGMGVVFLARERSLDRPVAIKVLRPELATASAAERFQREARTLANLRHASIVPIHRVGTADGVFYFVMEFLAGGTLADRLSSGSLHPRDAVQMGIDLLDALEQAHRSGVLHRDIKPANVFFRGDQPMLGDFGIAKTTSADEPALTGTGRVVGTPAYMAPEQLTGGQVTIATDIYAFGMLLYEAMMGYREPALVHQADPALWKGVPHGLRRVLARALAPDPGDRWPSAAAFGAALQRYRAVRSPWPVAAAVAITVGLAVYFGRPSAAAPGESDLAILPFMVSDGSVTEDDLGYALARTTADHLEADAANSGLSFTPMNYTVPWAAAREEGAPIDAPAFADLRARHVARGRVSRSGDTVAVRVEVMGRDGSVRVTERLTTTERHPYDLGFRVGHALVRILAPDRADTYRGSRALRGRSGPVIEAFNRGEAAFERELWAVAEQQYLRAIELDSTFGLAWWRLHNTRRWLRVPSETDLAYVYERHADEFNDLDRLLIRADLGTTVAARLRLYRQAIAHSPHDGFPWLLFGNEAFHRGGLVGYELDTALVAFDSAIARNRFLAPAHSTRAWALIRLGAADDAAATLKQYRDIAAPDETAPGFCFECFLDLAWTERFAPQQAGARRGEMMGSSSGALSMVQAFRWAPSLGIPRSQIAVGAMLGGAVSDPAVRATALVAQGLGYVAIGRMRAALAYFDSAAAEVSGPEFALQAAQWRVIPGVVGMDGVPVDEMRRGEEMLERLRRRPDLQARADWTLALRAFHAGDSATVTDARERIRRTVPAGSGLLAMLDALLPAGRGSLRAAADALEAVTALDVGGLAGDPFLRAVAHLLQGTWLEGAGAHQEADRTRRWYLNADLVGWPVGSAHAVEIDWAFEAHARYQRGTAAHERGDRALACRVLPEVRARWHDADAAFADRAARVNAILASCGPP